MNTQVSEPKTARNGSNVNLGDSKYNVPQSYKLLSGITNIYGQDKLTITVDWLQVTVSGAILSFDEFGKPKDAINFGSVDVLYVGSGGEHFERRAKIYLHGEHFADVVTCPRSRNIDRSNSIIKICNYQLYQRGWTFRLERVIECLGVQFSHFTKLDIAVDGGANVETLDHVIDNQKTIQKVGRASYHFPDVDGKDFAIKKFYVGSFKSKKLLRIYNKTKEIAHTGKGYITKFHERNGLDTTVDIERLEVSMKRDELKRYDIDLNKLEDVSYLASIMEASLKGFYEFVEVGSDKNVTRKEKYQVIDWAQFETRKIHKAKRVRDVSADWDVKQYLRISYQMICAKNKVLQETKSEDLNRTLSLLKYQRKKLRRRADALSYKKQINAISRRIRNIETDLHFLSILNDSTLLENRLSELDSIARLYGLGDYYRSRVPLWQKDIEKQDAYIRQARHKKDSVFTSSLF